MFETSEMTPSTKKEIKSTGQYQDFGATLLQMKSMQNATNSLQNKEKTRKQITLRLLTCQCPIMRLTLPQQHSTLSEDPRNNQQTEVNCYYLSQM